MKLHGNARTCPKSRRLLVGRVLGHDWSLRDAAGAAGVSERTAFKWVARFRAEGEVGLLDRSSAPKRIPHRTPADRVESIVALRRLRLTAAEIAQTLGMALSTVSLWLKRIGLGKRSRLDPPEPPNRYERSRPGGARPRRCQETGPHPEARPPRHRLQARPGEDAPRRQVGLARGLGVRPRRGRRPLAACLCRGPRR
jgi:transposase-like protein